MMRAQRAHRAHAFTLIELMAATLIGSLIVTSALGVFTALDRANTRFAVRYDHTVDMGRTYVAVQRAFRGMVVSPVLAPGDDLIPPRLSLTHVKGPIKMRAPGWASSRVLVVGDERDQPQRLEVVVNESPIESIAGQRLARLGVESLGLDPNEVTLAQPIAVRGAFVLRPVGSEGSTPLWQLVWQPMIALRPLEGAPYFVPAPADLDVVLADDIVWCRWQVFYKNERLLSHTAITVLDLPAYVELEIELTSGMMANWMFEIAWTEGPELEPDRTPTGIAAGNTGTGAVSETRTGDSVTGSSSTFTPIDTGGGGVDR